MSETRKARIRQLHESEIFAAAERLIQDKGLDNVTMDEIARLSGCAKGTLYNYFASKEILLASLIQCKMNDLLLEIRAIRVSENSPMDKLDHILTIWLKALYQDHQWLCAFYHKIQHDCSGEALFQVQHGRLYAEIHGFLSDLAAANLIRPMDFDLAVMFFINVAMGFGLKLHAMPKYSVLDLPGSVSIVKDLILNGIQSRTEREEL